MVVSAKSQKTKKRKSKTNAHYSGKRVIFKTEVVIHRIYYSLSRLKTYTFCQHKGVLNLQNRKKKKKKIVCIAVVRNALNSRSTCLRLKVMTDFLDQTVLRNCWPKSPLLSKSVFPLSD